MDIVYPSYHGSLIEQYFTRKTGRFEMTYRAIPMAKAGLFLCFTNRCGSTLVASEASSLGFCGKPNNHLNYEFFNADFVEEFSDRNDISNLQDYVEAIYEEFGSPLGLFFTKGSLDQLAWMKRCGVIGIAVPTYHYLRVVRRDLIAQAVSLLIAQQTGQWTTIHAPSADRPSYDHQSIADAVAYLAKTAAEIDIYFSILDINPTCFVYEDILADLAQIGQKLQGLTGLNALPRGPRTLDVQKQSQSVNEQWAQRFRNEVVAASAALCPPADLCQGHVA